jgi:hypothetical protein
METLKLADEARWVFTPKPTRVCLQTIQKQFSDAIFRSLDQISNLFWT